MPVRSLPALEREAVYLHGVRLSGGQALDGFGILSAWQMVKLT